MQLIYSPTSPYARKVRIVARECGHDGIEEIKGNPLEDGDEINKYNPLGKVPFLILDDGTALFDSPVICEYLDMISSNTEILPPSGIARIEVLRDQAFGDGIIDAVFSTAMETKKDDGEPSAFWLERWEAAVRRSLDILEKQIPSRDDRFDLGAITFVCALGYLDLRMSYIDWRKGRPNLVSWLDKYAGRACVVETDPND
jgi:glutathione S-transferase